jgi:hypothetical protein
MSLEFFLLCKKNYDNIINNLNNIIEKYDDIIFNTPNNFELNEISNTYKDKFILDLCYITCLRNECQNNVYNLCNHEFITDTIDISPEKSQMITYCKICEYTKQD